MADNKNSIEAFFTRPKADEGKQVPLSYPDGSESPHWIRIKGMDSEAYSKAFAAERKHLASFEGEIPDDEFEASKVRLLTAMVSGWSFEEDASDENVARLLANNPTLAEKLNRLAADTKFFFGQTGGKAKSS